MLFMAEGGGLASRSYRDDARDSCLNLGLNESDQCRFVERSVLEWGHQGRMGTRKSESWHGIRQLKGLGGGWGRSV